jgi:hypothetical protein
MRFMIIVKATKNSEAGEMPSEALISRMAVYHEELGKAGMFVDGSGLKPSAKGWRIRFTGEKRSVVDGPFAETKELIAGYTIIEAKSREEALEWTKRFPNPAIDGNIGEIEVRPYMELEDLQPSEGVSRFKDLRARTKSAS